MPYIHSFTNGWIGVSQMLKKLKTFTYFAQWTFLPLTHLLNLSILLKTTLFFPLKVTSTLPLFSSPSTPQFSSNFELLGFGWELLGTFLHSSYTFSISRCSLANFYASSLLIIFLILVPNVIVLRSEMQKKLATIVEMNVWSLFIGVKKDERDVSQGNILDERGEG
jgi:hypothetical protein